ncbi:MAG: 5'/3'-nucleotidase SurE [Verrucomicrobiota bacterium JB022]|nr:5'/3'-nucleotidase SurE [Verrucomicrobiota bacterium JB022]
MTRPTALVTNDDGVHSIFFQLLLEALTPHFRVVIAAPAQEQSWIGRAFSRRRSVEAEEVQFGEAKGWAIDGTPTDCVNIALGHLLPEKPDVVVSGINIGYNTSMPLILSSGTLAGAIEGAHWGIPAIAASQALPAGEFREAARSGGKLPEDGLRTVKAGAKITAKLALEIAGRCNSELHVHNLNFPYPMQEGTEVVETRPARVEARCLFGTTHPNRFDFEYNRPPEPQVDHATDRAVVRQGLVSLSILNFSALA